MAFISSLVIINAKIAAGLRSDVMADAVMSMLLPHYQGFSPVIYVYIFIILNSSIFKQ